MSNQKLIVFTIGLMTSLFLIGCKDKDNGDAINNDTMMDALAAGSETNNMMGDPPSETTPVPADEVYSTSMFMVDLRSDEVYGQGQTHSEWNAPNPEVMDLKLDLYVPENDANQRPLVVFTHGGGWSGGDKAGDNETEFCQFFAERGFVCASINYRLRGDRGTVPQEYADVVAAVEDISDTNRSQLFSMYPAGRDCKAALRWLVANASEIGVNVDSIALIGGSAGSFNSIAMDVTEPEDFRDELTLEEDPTLMSTNMDVEYEVQAVVNHWGGADMVNILGSVYNHNRFDSTDAPILIVHGTEDDVSPFSNAEALVELYTDIGVHNELVVLEGKGHGAWNATVDGKNLAEISFEFITTQLGLTVRE